MLGAAPRAVRFTQGPYLQESSMFCCKRLLQAAYALGLFAAVFALTTPSSDGQPPAGGTGIIRPIVPLIDRKSVV